MAILCGDLDSISTDTLTEQRLLQRSASPWMIPQVIISVPNLFGKKWDLHTNSPLANHISKSTLHAYLGTHVFAQGSKPDTILLRKVTKSPSQSHNGLSLSQLHRKHATWLLTAEVADIPGNSQLGTEMYPLWSLRAGCGCHQTALCCLPLHRNQCMCLWADAALQPTLGLHNQHELWSLSSLPWCFIGNTCFTGNKTSQRKTLSNLPFFWSLGGNNGC